MKKENVKGDGELEMLLDEIPHATSPNLVHLYRWHGNADDDHVSFVKNQGNHHGNGGSIVFYDEDPSMTQMKFSCASSPVTVSGFSLQSDGSSSSLFSAGHSLSDNGSPPPPPLEDLKSSPTTTTTITMSSGTGSSYNPIGTTFWFEPKIRDLKDNANHTERFVDELGLCASLSKMDIGNHQRVNPNPNPNVNNPINFNNKHLDDYNSYKRGLLDSDSLGFQFQSASPRNPMSHNVTEMKSALNQDYEMANFFGSQPCPGMHESVFSPLNGFNCSMPMDSPRHSRQLMNNYYCGGNVAPEIVAPLRRNPAFDASLYAQKYGMNSMLARGMSRLPNYPHCTNFRPYMTVEDLLQCGRPLPNARVRPPSNARIPQGNVDAITSEGSFILQGEGLNYVAGRGSNQSRCGSVACETSFPKHLPRPELDIRNRVAFVGNYENARSPRLSPKYNSPLQAPQSIYLMAKDQHGCRFLQRKFDEGRSEDVQVIFNEIIGHVVELMMNPFGNYLMQKLLDVCTEDQRMQIILMVTEEPGQLCRISLNSHGTRVVQKLIETLKTRQQVLLVISALEPGFLALIKDLNGNHVVQHCLQCLSNEDNKFIFVAAAKYCVDIATHQHGCCVLQKCIGHASGQRREKLVSEISANALLLAQDQYGNYVVQLILDLRIPSATATLTLQFEGNYVHLSMQKFSSHVVEKCLAVLNDEMRTRIIHELLVASHFEQLLQDPHANYVIQSALRHSEEHLHKSLVEAIESHKAISGNSPYSKKLLSQKLLKK